MHGGMANSTVPAAPLQVEHELECRGCGHLSRLTEQYTHLSLELPPAAGPAGQQGPPAQADVSRMLASYFQARI